MKIGVGFVGEDKVASITFPRLRTHDFIMRFLFIRIVNDSSIYYKKDNLLE